MPDPLAEIQLQQTIARLNHNTAHMLCHVLRHVNAGKTIEMSKHDRLHRVVNYADAHKRQMALGAIGLAVTGFCATGPVAVAIALPVAALGQAVTWSASNLWHLVRVSGKRRLDRVSLFVDQRLIGQDGQPFIAKAFNPQYKDKMFDEVRYILQYQGLTDVYNAFDNLQRDYDHIVKSGLVKIPPGGALATEDINQNVFSINTCQDAVRLLEKICRIRYRYGQVAETADLLADFVTYATLLISRYDAHGIAIVRMLWKAVLAKVPASDFEGSSASAAAAKVYESLIAGARRAGLKAGKEAIYEVLFAKAFGGRGDYDPTAGYDETVAGPLRTAMLIEVAPQVRQTNEKLARLILQRAKDLGLTAGRYTASGLMKLTEEMVGFSPVSNFHRDKRVSGAWSLLRGQLVGIICRENLEELTEFLLGKGSDVALGILEQVVGAAVKKSSADLATGALEGAWAQFFKGPEAIQAVALAVARVSLEVANSVWNDRKFRTQQTLPLLLVGGLRRQTLSERIGTLRTFAKNEISDYASVIDDWGKTFAEITKIPSGAFKTVIDPIEAAELLLRYKNAERRFYGNRCGYLLQETLFHTIREFQTVADELLPAALVAIDGYMANASRRDHLATKPCEPYCYCHPQGRLLIPEDKDDFYGVPASALGD